MNINDELHKFLKETYYEIGTEDLEFAERVWDRAMAVAESMHAVESLCNKQAEPVGYVNEMGQAVLFKPKKCWLDKDKEHEREVRTAKQYYGDSLLYTAPPAVAVNEQMLEALHAMLEYTAHLDVQQGMDEHDHPAVKKAAAAIAVAEAAKKGGV